MATRLLERRKGTVSQQAGRLPDPFLYSLGSTETEVEEIEARLLYFPSDRAPVKSVFFTISTGRHVVARIVPLDDPDRAGRGGRYLAHSLVFAAEEFAGLGSDPFQVFRHFSFLATIEEALTQGDFQTGDIPPISLEISPDLPSGAASASDWSTSELKKLVLLALRAGRRAHDKAVVAFVGEPQLVEAALEAAYVAVPVPLRSRCSFDSYFHKGNPVATHYWAVGLLEPPNNPRFTSVDARSRHVLGAVSEQPETAYERWVMALIDAANGLASITQQKEYAFALCEWLEGRTSDLALADAAPSEVRNSVFQVNTQQVGERLRQRLSERLSPILVSRIFENFSHQTNTAELFQQLRHGFALSQLLEGLYQTYAERGLRAPERVETKALGELLRREDHRALRLAYLCWTDQYPQLRQALERLPENNYREFVQTALRQRIVEPLRLLAPGKGELFLDLYLSSRGEPAGNFVGLVKALLETGQPECLSRFVAKTEKRWAMPTLQGLSGKELKALEKLAGGHPGVPEAFRHAVREAMAALPAPKGIAGLLRTLLGRSSRS